MKSRAKTSLVISGDRTLLDEFPSFLNSQQALISALELVQAGIFVASARDSRLIYTNRVFDRALRLGNAEPLDGPWYDYIFDSAERTDIIARTGRGDGLEEHEIRLLRDNGDPIQVKLAMARLEGADGHVLFGSFVDLTLQKETEAKVQRLADRDALTGLPNPRCIRDRLERALSRAKRHGAGVAVMFVDLDRFKAVNDTFGHAVGDEVLRTVSHRLRSVVRDCDTVGRQGGDEFVLMLTDIVDPAILSVVARRAVDAIAAPINIDGSLVQVGASIGIASFPEHGGDVDELMRRADQAMYGVKRAGKNNFRVAA